MLEAPAFHEPSARMNQGLTLGIDYYVEDGKIVFQAAYHRKRGYCCNSRCRHCPFKSPVEGEGERVEIVALPKEPR